MVNAILFLLFIIFHWLLGTSNPIHSLFLFLFFIISEACLLLMYNLVYLAFVLISVYGGAIVVLFLLVSMLFNQKLGA